MGFNFHFFKTVSKANSCSKQLQTPNFPTNLFLVANVVSVLFSSGNKHSMQTVYVDKSYWPKVALLSSISLPNSLPYIVDGIQFTSQVSKTQVQYNLNNMADDSRLSIYTEIDSKDLFLPSVNNVFPSSTWLERELCEFTGLLFIGAVDSRRLLLDYFQNKQQWKTHTNSDKSYSNVSYEFVLNY